MGAEGRAAPNANPDEVARAQAAEAEQFERVHNALAGRYTLKHALGRGGMATVYLAHDLKHGRSVAIKVLHPQLGATLAAARFLREIEIAASLTHPNILPVHDSGEMEGLLYFTMPFVEGESLRARLDREGSLSVDVAIEIAREVADALDSAHRHGVVHRDVKPENILFEEGHAVVTDFGVARAVSEAGGTRLTTPGLPLGTPRYISPEQATGEEVVDQRSDLYSLACVLYEMLAGRPPFTERDARALLARHVIDRPPSLVAVRPEVPNSLEGVVMRALAKSPADRFESLKEFAEALAFSTVEEVDAIPSIAVLPLANLSASPEDEYLSDGITEEITSALSRIKGLHVASRTSAFVFKDRGADAREIGRTLGVGSLLEGSLQRAGSRLRVTVQLIDAADGYHLWSERYDREMEDVFAIQDEIAANVVRALRVMLTDSDRKTISRVPTCCLAAYESYLRGRQFFHQGRRKSLEFARQMFRRAIDIDPDFAPAHAGFADSCSLLAHWYGETDVAVLREAEAASRKALALDPDLPQGHAARGFALWQLGRTEESDREFETAIGLDPRLFEARYFYARASYQQGKLERAARLFEEACRIREDHDARYFGAQTYSALGRLQEAEDSYRRAIPLIEKHLELNPDDVRAVTMGAVSLARLGQREAGFAWAERALAIDPADAGVKYNVACLYAVQGEKDRAIALLEEAVEAGFAHRDWVEHDPDLDSLRDEPRFQALPWPE